MSKYPCCGGKRNHGHPPLRVKTSRTCVYLVATDIPHGRRCDRPAGWKWHDDDDEFFCEVHKLGEPADDSEETYNEFWSTKNG